MDNQATVRTAITKLKNYYRKNPWKGRLIIAFCALTITLGIVRLVMPHTIIYAATSWLKERGVDSTIDDVNINILNGTFSLVNAHGTKDGETLFHVGLIDIHLQWTPLSNKSVVVTKVELDNLEVNIGHYSDEIFVGGVHIPLTSEEPETAEEIEIEETLTTPWTASLGEVIFTNLNVCYLDNVNVYAEASSAANTIDYCVNLDEMGWGGTISYATDPTQADSTDLIISSTGDFKLNGLTVTDNKLDKMLLGSSSNTLNNVVITGLNSIHIDLLEMNGLSALQRNDTDHKDAIRFQQLSLNDISLTDLNSLTINSVEVKDPGLYIVKLNESDWEYQQWLPATTKTNEELGAGTTEPTAAFKFAINNIQINNADFCYLEEASDLYYCFAQENLTWDGSINASTEAENTLLDIKGDLIVSNTNINNPKLGRDLVNIESIALNKLNVTDLDEISLGNFTVNKFMALQRSEKESDSTIAFSSLVIDKSSYTKNNIAIDTITLAGLSSTVSKNKNETWEHDKWLPRDKSKKEEKEASENKTDDKSEPLLISIKSATVTTDKEILFIDNSTNPQMKTGLSSLEFNIKDLIPDKPNTDSPFKLFAKTILHSTVDIGGTVRPYSSKVAIDAKGKLKGFDLRAASPATKKSIGHIIKSGQLDADFNILAVDGILDSNIGLSLYQFHIKPMNKEDAAKLDKELGMPLNQTLTMLRDKDDSIHLDIPITGDVNNPDFNPMDAILKATTKAATVTLITFYTPYGLIYAGGNVLFDLATAMNFDPIAFDAGSAKLPADGEKQLANLGKLLTEKPQVHLSLCGMTNKEDVYVLYPALKKSVEKDKKEVAPTLSKDQKLALEKLATDRQIASKNYLIKELSITHDRLILCHPEYQIDGEAFSGVEINI